MIHSMFIEDHCFIKHLSCSRCFQMLYWLWCSSRCYFIRREIEHTQPWTVNLPLPWRDITSKNMFISFSFQKCCRILSLVDSLVQPAGKHICPPPYLLTYCCAIPGDVQRFWNMQPGIKAICQKCDTKTLPISALPPLTTTPFLLQFCSRIFPHICWQHLYCICIPTMQKIST